MQVRRILAMFLALALVVGAMPISAFAAEEEHVHDHTEETKPDSNVEVLVPDVKDSVDYPALTEGESVEATISTAGETVYYSFTPSVSCWYYFYSEVLSTRYDTYACLYDSNMSQLASNDDGNDYLQFGLSYCFTAGETYVLGVKMLSDSATGSFAVNVEQRHVISYEYLSDAICTEDHQVVRTCNQCGYSDTVTESALGHSYVEGYCQNCGDVIYEEGTCGDDLTWVLDGNTLTISGSGDMYDYGWMSAPWHSYYTNVVNVVIEEGVTSIGAYSFSGCDYLRSVSIPETVTRIGYYCFYSVDGLERIVLPDSITEIEFGTFLYCSDLKQIKLPENLTSIGESAFRGCNYLEAVSLPDSVTTISSDAFAYCNLQSLHLPSSLTYIGSDAFYSSELRNISIPAGVTQIGSNAFGANDLTMVLFEGNVPSIGHDAFYTYAETLTFYYPAGNDTWTADVTANGFGAESFSWQSYSGVIILEQPIDVDAFDGENVEVSVLAGGADLSYAWYVAAPGADSFTLSDQTGAVYTDTMTEETAGIQLYCVITDSDGNELRTDAATVYPIRELKPGEAVSVEIANPGETVYVAFTADTYCRYRFESDGGFVTHAVFYNEDMEYLFEIDGLGDGYREYIDAGTTYILAITMSDYEVTGNFNVSVKMHINYNSWIVQDATCETEGIRRYECNVCGEVWDEAIPPEHNYHMGYCSDCGEAVDVSGVCGDNLTWTLGSDCVLRISGTGDMYNFDLYGSPWYDYRYSITSAILAEGVTSIGYGAFSNCDYLTDVSVPNTVTALNSRCFFDLDSLTSITLPASVSYIDTYAFDWCNSLKEINVAEGNETYASYDGVLYSKDMTTLLRVPHGMTELVIPDGVTTIASHACAQSQIKWVTIPESVTVIEDVAFNNCYCLESVVLPAQVTYVGFEAFAYCYMLKYAVIPASVSNIKNYAFLDDYRLETVVFAGDVEEVGYGILIDCYATAYYPANSETWTEDVRNNCGDGIDWVPYEGCVILVQPEDMSVIDGQTVSVSLEAYGDIAGYAWYVKAAGSEEFVLDAAQTGTDYTVNFTEDMSGMQLYCVVTDTAGHETVSNTVTLTAALLLQEGEEELITLTDDSMWIDVYFTAEYDCNYYFRFNSDYYIEVALEVGEDDWNWYSWDFSRWLYAGNTYHLRIYNYSGMDTVDLTFKVTAHDDRWSEITVEPTCTTDGERTYHCNRCGAVWTEVIPATHDFHNGYCTDCNEPLNVSGVCGDNLTWTLGSDCVLRISGTGEMYDVGYQHSPWYEYRQNIFSVVIGEGVTSIGRSAFYGCYNMTEIAISDTVVTIGDYVFGYCDDLESVYIPVGVNDISTYTFLYCDNLEQINVSEDNTTYASVDGILYSKDMTTLVRVPEGVKELVIPDGVQYLADYSVYSCEYLVSVSVPDSLVRIGEQAFYNAYNLKEIILPENLQYIGSQAFYNCDELKTVIIPETVTYVGPYAFGDCYDLETVVFAGDPVVEYGVFSGDSLTAYYPAGSTNLDENARENCWGDVTWIQHNGAVILGQPTGLFGPEGSVVSTTVEVYGEFASYAWYVAAPGSDDFVLDASQTTNTYTTTVTVEMDGAHVYCVAVDQTGAVSVTNEIVVRLATELEDMVEVESSVEVDEAANFVFTPVESCYHEMYVSNVNGEVRISITDGAGYSESYWISGGTYRFILEAGKTYLISVTKDESYTDRGFTIRMSLSHNRRYEVVEEKTCTEDGLEICYCTECGKVLEEYVIEAGHEFYEGYCEVCGEELNVSGQCGENVYWSLGTDCVLRITGTGPMYNYDRSESNYSVPGWYEYGGSIRAIEIGEGVTSIGDWAFAYTWYVSSITISESVKSIGSYAFVYLENLESISLPSKLESIGDFAFSGCWCLTTVEIPATVRSIGAAAFGECSSLAQILVDDNNSWYCDVDGVVYSKDMTTLVVVPRKVTSLEVPEGVTTIADYAAYGTRLANIKLPSTLVSIGKYAFTGSRVTTFVIPVGVKSIGECAFAWSYYLEHIVFTGDAPSIGDMAFSELYIECMYPADNDTWTDEVMVDYGGEITWSEFEGVLIINQPGNTSAFAGTDAEVSVYAYGEGLTYQWYVLAPGAEEYVLSDQQTNTFTMEVNAQNNGTMVYCVVTDENGASVTSETAKIRLIPEIEVDTETSVEILTTGDYGYFTFTPEVSGRYFFRCLSATDDSYCEIYDTEWNYIASNDDYNGLNFGLYIDLEAGKTYILCARFLNENKTGSMTVALYLEKAYDDEHTHDYEAVVTEPSVAVGGYTTYTCACGDSYVDDYTDRKGLSKQPEDTTTYVDLKASFSVEADEEGLTYVWYRKFSTGDWEVWSGMTSSVTTAITCKTGHDGMQVYCVVTDANGNSVTSDVATLTVKSNPFNDVASGKYYYEPIMWAIENGVTAGKTPTEFGVTMTCTRAQIVTFLWRAMGEPEPTTTTSPFTDVQSKTAYYYKAVLWAVENDITSGKTATTFGVNEDCTREQIVTFLWRTMGKPEPTTTTSPFTDVQNTSSYYYKAVLWAVENGITSGSTATTFGVKQSCTRAQAVTFLYKAMLLMDEE